MRSPHFVFLILLVQFSRGEDYYGYYGDDDDYVITEDYEEQFRMSQMGHDAQEIHDRALEFAIAGDLNQALPLFERAAHLDSGNHGFWSDLGVTQMRLNYLDDAKQSFEHAEKIKPGTELIRANLVALQEHLDFREDYLRKEREKNSGYDDNMDDEYDPYEDEVDLYNDDMDDEDAEMMIDEDNFSSLVVNSDKVWILEYYSDKCGSCKEFLPTWHEVSKSMSGLKLGRVNIDNKKGMKLAKDHGILNRGIPAVRVIHNKRGDGDIIMAGKLMDARALKDRIHSIIDVAAKMDPYSGAWLKRSDEL